MKFKLHSRFKPAGDQSKAIKKLLNGIEKGKKDQTLLGVTGSGKTFVMANLIEKTQKPTLIISHNKTLAAQLYQEIRDFFPQNAVEYFVSYYDYYQPESYMPATDTYIEKDADVNEEIDRLRMSTTASLITRNDVIVIASVSCIYNLGSPLEYQNQIIRLQNGLKFKQHELFKKLQKLYYNRNDFDFKRGTYRVRGDAVDIYPAYQNFAIRLNYLNDVIKEIKYFDPTTGEGFDSTVFHQKAKATKAHEDYIKANISNKGITVIYPAKHYVAPEKRFEKAVKQIQTDLQKRVEELNKANKKLEAYRITQRTNYDLEMIQEIGYCKGIENYSRYFDGRKVGEAPYSLMDYFKKNYLLFIDESHMTIPQIRGMYNGDQARKRTLVDYGFRLTSALDNRPLKFDEFERRMGQTIYASATPSDWEKQRSSQVVELFIRPTGLIDPKITILPSKGQILDLEKRIQKKIENKTRTLVTTLTKRMSEELASYFQQKGYKVAYLHSDIETLERSDILDNLRNGKYDVLIGINLLREGLDLPEVSLVAILDADKEGFLRSETALVQTMGRAARHVQGEVVMYADNITGSMHRAIDEVDRRRRIQIEYNKKHKITPRSILKPIRKRILEKLPEDAGPVPIKELNVEDYEFKTLSENEKKRVINTLEKKMKIAAEILEFEVAAKIRDKVRELKSIK